MPTLQGKYKVPHFDAKGEADALFTQAGVPTTFLLTVVLLGELHLLRRRAEARAGRQARAGDADGRQEAARASPPTDIGKCALGIFKRGQRVHREDRRHRRRAPQRRRRWPPAMTHGAGRDGRLPGRAARGLPRLRTSPARTTWATCSSSSATSTSTSRRRGAWSCRRSLNPELQSYLTNGSSGTASGFRSRRRRGDGGPVSS